MTARTSASAAQARRIPAPLDVGPVATALGRTAAGPGTLGDGLDSKEVSQYFEVQKRRP